MKTFDVLENKILKNLEENQVPCKSDQELLKTYRNKIYMYTKVYFPFEQKNG